MSAGATRLLHFRGSRPLFAEELRTRVAAGARLVRFEFCFSLVFVTVRRQSAVYLTNSWQQRYLYGLQYSLLALLLGPWGVPWGVLWTAWAWWVNATGGADCTEEVLATPDAAASPDADTPDTPGTPGAPAHVSDAHMGAHPEEARAP